MVEIAKRLSEITIDNRPPIELEESFHALHIRCINSAYNYLLSKPIDRMENNTSSVYFYMGIIIGVFVGMWISNWDLFIKLWAKFI